MKVYELESVSLFRKYWGIFDLPFSLASGQLMFVSSLSNILKAQVSHLVIHIYFNRSRITILQNKVITHFFMLCEFILLKSCTVCFQRAMIAHKTQLVWFRILYIIFSRYMIINTYTLVKP